MDALRHASTARENIEVEDIASDEILSQIPHFESSTFLDGALTTPATEALIIKLNTIL